MSASRAAAQWTCRFPEPRGAMGRGVLGAAGLPRAGSREGMLAKAGSAFLYSKLGFMLDVGKCSKVDVIDGKGICGVRPMRVIR